MRQLIVIRHAKSDWNDPDLSDHDRPLNPRGLRDAPVMGRRLARSCAMPVTLITSSAVRARATASLMAAEMGIVEDAIRVDARLYGASAAALLNYIRELADADNPVAIIAHNPGLTELVNILSDHEIENLPTCSYAVLNFDVTHWRQVAPGLADMSGFDYPKRPL